MEGVKKKLNWAILSHLRTYFVNNIYCDDENYNSNIHQCHMNIIIIQLRIVIMKSDSNNDRNYNNNNNNNVNINNNKNIH